MKQPLFPLALTAVMSLAVGVMLAQTTQEAQAPVPTPQEPITCPDDIRPVRGALLPPVVLHPVIYERYECWHAGTTGRQVPGGCT